MIAALVLIAVFTLATAAVALSLRNLIHSALLLIASWFGIAAFYLWAGAEFVAFAQVLVYVGAVSMVVLFAVLLTRRSRADTVIGPDSVARAISAVITGVAVFGVLGVAILKTSFGRLSPADVPPLPGGTGVSSVISAPTATVRDIGIQLMSTHAAALLIIGILLTVALLGAVVLAAQEGPESKQESP
jgi:NADH:ubiquinone oxidoreductase subunit 6 (subunit J)